MSNEKTSCPLTNMSCFDNCAWWLDDGCCIVKYVTACIEEKSKAASFISQIQQALPPCPFPCPETDKSHDGLIGDPIRCETCLCPIDKCTCNVTNK